MDVLISPTMSRRDPNNSTHKAMKQNLDRLESTVSAVPQALGEYVDAFNSYCLCGVKLASLLETLFQETPILLVALRFREACEQLGDKCTKMGVLQKQEVVGPVKRIAPALSKLRGRVESHGKVITKHESYFKQLEQLKDTHHPKKEKLESKFHASAEEFAREDAQLAEALNDLHQLRVEVMGSCFLSFLEAQAKMLSSASDVMAPLGAYKEVGKGLSDSPTSSVVKEATVGWLAAAQVNPNLRSFGGLTRNDVQCMMYNSGDGLPSTIQVGLNSKVNQLIKMYTAELQRAPNPHHKVPGGFHLNPKGIELALRDCCSELEALGAGADHAKTKAEKEEQITRDVSRTSFKISDRSFGCAMGEQIDVNIKEKMGAVAELISRLPLSSQLGVSQDTINEFTFHILNESCTTVTNTAAKTAVQLVFGKANLVLVRPSSSSEDNSPIDISSRSTDSSIQIAVHSSWWLVEDYAALAMLSRPMDPNALLGVVDATYTVNFTLQRFLKEDSPPELPSIAVTYRLPNNRYSPNLSSSHKDKDKFLSMNRAADKIKTLIRHVPLARSLKQPSFQSYVDFKREDRGGTSRRVSSDSDTANELSSSSVGSHGSVSSLREFGGSGSLHRGMRHNYHYGYGGTGLRRTGSSETVSSQSTLVPRASVYETDESSVGITDLLPSEIRQQSLTQSRIRDFVERSEERRYHRPFDRREREMYDYPGREKEGFPEKDEDVLEEQQATAKENGCDQESARKLARERERERLSIASDSEVQNVIDFLSRSPFPDTEDPFPQYGFTEPQVSSSSSSPIRPGEFPPYPPRYPGYSTRNYGDDYREWVRENPTGNDERNVQGDNSSSPGTSGFDDPYRRGREQYLPKALRSRSGSATDLHAKGETGHTAVEGTSSHPPNLGTSPHSGSVDSGIHLHPVGKKPLEGSRGEHDISKENRRSQELPVSLDFSKGFGVLIPSERHSRFAMDMLHDSPLDLYQRISDSDSDDHSGRDSIPPISSSSSGSQSPLFKSRTEEIIRAQENERSASRTSTHSMPYMATGRGSSLSLNELDLAPGSRPRPYPEYGDSLSQGSDGGGRGSLSQGSIGLRDPTWDMRPDYHGRRPREQYGRPYEYDGPMPGGGGYPFNDPPPHMQRESRSLQRGSRGRSYDNYSPSPGPPTHDFDPRHGPMMPPPPQGYWSGYDLGYERGRASSTGPPIPPHPNGPHPPPPMHGHLPPGPSPVPHPMHDNRFRPLPFRPNTPSDAPSPASIHSMSPAPSPRPTPPPTPPPPNPNLMGPHPGPGGPPHLPPPPHPHGPPPHLHGPPPPHRGPAPNIPHGHPPHMPPGPGPGLGHGPGPGPGHGPRGPGPGPGSIHGPGHGHGPGPSSSHGPGPSHCPGPHPPGPRDFPPPPLPHRGPGPHPAFSHAPSPNVPAPPVSMHGRFPLPLSHPPEWDHGWHR